MNAQIHSKWKLGSNVELRAFFPYDRITAARTADDAVDAVFVLTAGGRGSSSRLLHDCIHLSREMCLRCSCCCQGYDDAV